MQNLDEGTYEIPNKNPHFFVITEPKSDGVFTEMQIISYICIILKHIQVSSQFLKLLMLEVWLSFFWQSVSSTVKSHHPFFLMSFCSIHTSLPDLMFSMNPKLGFVLMMITSSLTLVSMSVVLRWRLEIAARPPSLTWRVVGRETTGARSLTGEMTTVKVWPDSMFPLASLTLSMMTSLIAWLPISPTAWYLSCKYSNYWFICIHFSCLHCMFFIYKISVLYLQCIKCECFYEGGLNSS